MATATITPKQSRDIIAKLRKVPAHRPAFYFASERIRKNTTRAEQNTYALDSGKVEVRLDTTAGTITAPEVVLTALGVTA